MTEANVFSEKYGFAGTFDAVAVDKSGKYVVLDWKTSNMLNSKYAVQIAAYAKVTICAD